MSHTRSSATRPVTPPLLERTLGRLEDASSLDPVADAVQPVADRLTRARTTAAVLHGAIVGHPLHPVLVQATLGLLLSATTLDVLGRPEDEPAARTLVGLGLLSATPTAVAGLADWGDGHEQQKRVGVVHAATNVAGLMLYGVSFARRRRGGGRASSLIGLAMLTGGAYLGAHLSFRQALGANHVEHVPHRAPAEWTRLCAFADLPDGEPTQQLLGDQPLLVLRQGSDVHVLSDVCSHLSGPLHEGEITDDGCVVCPWHGSTFRLDDGAVVRSPATAPVPVFEVRRDGSDVLVRLPGAG